jgi:hypothetical protein
MYSTDEERKQARKDSSKRYREKQRLLTGRASNCRYEVRFLSAIKGRAIRNGLDFDLTYEDVIFPDYCPVLGIAIDFSKPGRSDNSPSMDRIDNTKGYVKGNVEIISWRANRIKNDGTAEEHVKIAEYIKGRLI